MSGRVRKLWALRAQRHSLEQLAAVRARAEQWRNGLVGLTTLLGAVTIIEGPSTTAKLPPALRDMIVDQLSLAFLALLAGSLAAMVAAFGWPANEMLITGETLAAWEASEARRARLTLKFAAGCLVLGLVLIGVATRSLLLAPADNPALVAVEKVDGSLVCGALDGGDEASLQLTVTDVLGDEATNRVDYSAIRRVRQVDQCPQNDEADAPKESSRTMDAVADTRSLGTQPSHFGEDVRVVVLIDL